MSKRIRERALLVVGGTGAALFVCVFLLTFSTPQWVEDFAAAFIAEEVSEQIDHKIDSLRPPAVEGALARAAAALRESNEKEIARRKEELRVRAHERAAAAIAEIRDLDCECRAKWAQWLKQGAEAHVSLLQIANQNITDFIHASYARVVADQKRDMRIFAAANAAMFLLVLGVAFIKSRASAQLFVPAVLLVAATVTCSYFYVFEQNWLLTIIYDDYLGCAYLAYLALVFGLLCDVVLNRARISTVIANASLHAIGSAASVEPC